MTNEPTQAEVQHERDKMRRVARFDAMTEIAHQLIGSLVARENAATSADERDQFKTERQAILRQLHHIDPNDTDRVDELLATWSAQVREQRGI